MFVDHQFSVEVLLQHADIAMYQAKKFGRSTLRFFNQHMQDKLKSNALIRSDLLQAFEKQQLQLYYQIQVDDFSRPYGAEALIRWVHPDRGLMLPDEFIPVAEENGLILHIGDWVIEAACTQLSMWNQSAITSSLSLSINISAKQFKQPNFSEEIQSAIARHGVNPKLLKLELTESILLENVSEIIDVMKILNKIGVRFSLDDFGTGYSSLKRLKELPLHQVKIDQSFVNNITTDSTDLAIVQTTIVMANILNLDLIAEGVETEEQWKILKDNGCKSFQGYFFGKPEPIHEFEAHLKSS
jgi:EAL domain-containing protein (putative c-di-GMP-specific phosphodiesterase class I)